MGTAGCNCATGYALRSVAASGREQKSSLKNPIFCIDNPNHFTREKDKAQLYHSKLIEAIITGPVNDAEEQMRIHIHNGLAGELRYIYEL